MKVIEFDETRPESLGAFFAFWGGDDFYLYTAGPAVQMGLRLMLTERQRPFTVQMGL